MAYWLGFLAADGNIKDKTNALTFVLKESDRCAIEQFKKDLKFSGTIYTRVSKAKNKFYPCCGVTICSKQIKEDLSHFNIIPRKSLLGCSFISTIPEEYKKSFVVRFFDGDGHISENKGKIEFLGSETDCKEIINIFSFKKFRLAPENEKGLYALIINSFKEKEKFLSFYQEFSYKNKEKKTNKSRYCVECSQKAQQKVKRPSKEVLSEEIKKYSFLYLGHKYRVSDNAVRKWCKKYNIPYRKKDII